METKKMISLTLAELLAVSWAWGAVAADCEAADYLPPAVGNSCTYKDSAHSAIGDTKAAQAGLILETYADSAGDAAEPPPAGVILKGGQIDSSTVEVGAFDDSLLNEGGKMRLLRRICGLRRGGLDDGDRGSRLPARRGDRCGDPQCVRTVAKWDIR